jgi:opacity protein-like surface antigen
MSAYVIAALVAAALPGAAMAQSTSPAPIVPPATASSHVGVTQSHWIVSGFVGSNFGGATATDPSVDFGGQLAWLWRGVFGGEVLADFAPSFKVDNLALSENPRANGYMANAIFAVPLGAEGQFQPYISGGLGAIQLQTRVFNAALPRVSGTPIPTGTTDGDEVKRGTNVGAGLMGFAGIIGFRADIRYYKAATDTSLQSTTPVGQFTETLLSGLDYWRANIGVAIRW